MTNGASNPGVLPLPLPRARSQSAIFRGANGQKDAFRRDPNAPGVRHLKVLEPRRAHLRKEGSQLPYGG
eukprot:gene2437-8277_t